jgi:hypothetical protein
MVQRDWVEWHRDYDDPGCGTPDLTPAIRSWFGEAGFREEAFDTSPDGFMSVGAHRLAGEPAALALGRRLFTVPGGTEPGPNLTTLSP